MESQYLTKEHLIGFDNYKYNCIDNGVLSIYVMHPFWNWVVKYCPRSIAPNLLTFTGFLFTVATYIYFAFLDYNFYAADPDHPEVEPLGKWPYMTAAIFLFIAYTLDGIDGKQARRTGTSGPLGELFDHGLDSYTAGLIPGAMYSIFSRGAKYSIVPYRMYFTMWNVMMNFYMTHFEKYNTGVMFLPWGYDFSMWGTILTFFLAGIFGAEIWQFRIGSVTAGNLLELTLYVSSLISNVPVISYNIYKSYKNKTGKMRSFVDAIRPLTAVGMFFVLSTIWVQYSPGNIVERDPRALFFLLGTVFSNISCRLIVAQMSNTTFDAFNLFLIPTSFVVAVSLFTQWATLELILLYALCLFTTIAHVHYGTSVVREMCQHFKVNCFTIKKPSD
ncbi:unnamed protein product [Psylliodes chrysocephalus]|uniref:Ethanolaminephosphotransferase n=1 Tax=Psylliodes chrysocephalus TaxID=3402493 RepID=A0A9P0DD46_9CUCU|nr:unnamed protein product [Psylliodes chrysocephala]